MKRAKILLTTLGVLAVVGGTLAFKARNTYQGNLRCTTFTATKTTLCPLVTYSTTIAGGIILACTEITAPDTAPCCTMRVTFNP